MEEALRLSKIKRYASSKQTSLFDEADSDDNEELDAGTDDLSEVDKLATSAPQI
ncbi:MAG: hypothetical protein L3J75_03375 [Methylococcaceae bacterium]|nr:hypothetical protein [Methylococcaceae bacterium]